MKSKPFKKAPHSKCPDCGGPMWIGIPENTYGALCLKCKRVDTSYKHRDSDGKSYYDKGDIPYPYGSFDINRLTEESLEYVASLRKFLVSDKIKEIMK